jgi:regulatory protein
MFVRALRILAARPRSEKQLRDRLLANAGADAAAIDDCITRLKELGYIEDGRFAESYASHRISMRPMGRARIARELAHKKVDRSTITRALDSVFSQSDEEELLDRALERRIRTHGAPVDDRAAKRMFEHLARLGFEYESIVRRIRSLRKATRCADDRGDGSWVPE